MPLTRGKWIVLVLIAGGVATAATVGYHQWPQLKKRFDHQAPSVTPTADQGSTTPPFSTKEPDRYQAIRIISESTGESPNERTAIARDGANRREERDLDRPGSTVYIETAGGHFLLLPVAKMYVDLDAEDRSGDGTGDKSEDESSPDHLLHETTQVTRYHRLGPELLAQRRTIKYLVDIQEPAQPAQSVLIWIDEEFGMPVRSEMQSENGGVSTMELTNIKRDVDPHLFEVPADYKKVDFPTFQKELQRLR